MDVDLARPGSIMVHFGTSRRFMGGRYGSLRVDYGALKRLKPVYGNRFGLPRVNYNALWQFKTVYESLFGLPRVENLGKTNKIN